MNNKKRSSDKLLFISSALIILGRIGLFISVVYISFCLVFQYPLALTNTLVIFSVSVAFLLASAYLLQVYDWLLDILIQCIIVVAIVLGGIVVRLYLARVPHFMTVYEIIIFALCVLVCVLSVLGSNSRRRKSRSSKRPFQHLKNSDNN